MGYKEQWIEDLRVNVYNLYIFLEISKRGNLGYHLCGCCDNLGYICIELFKKWQMRKSLQYGFTDSYLILIFQMEIIKNKNNCWHTLYPVAKLHNGVIPSHFVKDCSLEYL